LEYGIKKEKEEEKEDSVNIGKEKV